jgi:hypothetical protein
LRRAFRASLFPLMVSLALAGCATSTVPRGASVFIDGLTFENRSTTPINGITLQVPATGGFVSCGRIAPGARCASGFPGVSYAGDPVEIRWYQGGAEWTTGLAALDVEESVREAGRGEVRVLVLAPGSAGALLLPGGSVGVP